MKEYFKDTSNLISFALGLIPAFVFYVLEPKLIVPLWLLLAVISLLCVSIWLLVKSRLDIMELSIQTIQIIGCSHGFCLCKPNNLITYSSWVMFYENSGDFEKIIALGRVETITQKGIAQIKVFSFDDICEDILTHINDEKNKIIVRPTLTTEAIQTINNILEV